MKPQNKSISEHLTSPLGKGLIGAGSTAGTLLAANKLLGTQRAAKLFARMGMKPAQISGRNIAGSSAAAGGIAAIFANPERSMYAKSVMDKIQRGGKFTGTEKRLLGLDNTGVQRRAPKTLSERYFDPASMGVFRSAVGGLMGGFSPLAFAEGAAAGAVGTAANRALMTTALKNRIESGRNLNKSERLLAAYLRSRNA